VVNKRYINRICNQALLVYVKKFSKWYILLFLSLTVSVFSKQAPLSSVVVEEAVKRTVILLEQNIYLLKLPLLHKCVNYNSYFRKTAEKKALQKLLKMLILAQVVAKKFADDCKKTVEDASALARATCIFILNKQPEVSLALEHLLDQKRGKKKRWLFFLKWIALPTICCGVVLYTCYQLMVQVKKEAALRQAARFNLHAQQACRTEEVASQVLVLKAEVVKSQIETETLFVQLINDLMEGITACFNQQAQIFSRAYSANNLSIPFVVPSIFQQLRGQLLDHPVLESFGVQQRQVVQQAFNSVAAYQGPTP
jgi:hypothetical protein